MDARHRELVSLLATECKSTKDITTLLRTLFAETVEEMLEAEMEEHLGYEKHSPEGDLSGNSRNGYNRKKLQSEFGVSEIRVPRDRNGEFQPMLIEKRQTKTDDIENRIIAMYAKGMSDRDIEDHLRDIYGVEMSASLISRITDKIMPMVSEWQSRPLERVYPIVFLDGIVYKVRKDGKVVNECVYSVLGIDMTGHKDILGIWTSANESASFWLSVCNELKNRGVEDILIVCRDNLSGFSKAVETAFPRAQQQLCVIHQIRNSTKYISWKDLKPLMADLKNVYAASTLEAAEYALEEFREKWGGKYPQVLKSWDENWAELTTYFQYPQEIRRLIYTTNAVEGYHRMLRKYTKTKTAFPTENALRKTVYLTIQEIMKKWSMPVKDWGTIIGQFMIFFGDRFDVANAG